MAEAQKSNFRRTDAATVVRAVIVLKLRTVILRESFAELLRFEPVNFHFCTKSRRIVSFQIDRQIDKCSIWMDGKMQWMDRSMDGWTDRDRDKERQRDRQIDRQTDRQLERQREIERNRKGDRDRQRNREMKREREREKILRASTTFWSISRFVLPSMHHNNSPLLQPPIFETSATALCGPTWIKEICQEQIYPSVP